MPKAKNYGCIVTNFITQLELEKKRKSSFKTEKAALKALLEVKVATLQGETKHIEHDNLTVGQWLDDWLEMNKTSGKLLR